MEQKIMTAVDILHRGGLVAFPTETVYGLGADAKNARALRQIFIAKQRPIDHPLIVHIADMVQLSEWARDIPDSAFQLANIFWPGPLTLILKKAPGVLDLITGGQETIGIRIPRHPVAQALLKRYGGGLAAPSANRFGRISPTTAEAVREELGDAVDLILDGDQCEVGLESTIIDVSGAKPVVLRPGMITTARIAEVLNQPIANKPKDAPRVSGSHASHYAPATQTLLMTTAELDHYLQQQKHSALAVLGFAERHVAGVENISMSKNPAVYAHDLYKTLRDLDKKNLQKIIIEAVPESSAWDAIRDRLQRATAKS